MFTYSKFMIGICMTKEPLGEDSIEIPEVISIGTGTKTLTGDHLNASGTGIYDSHGEIVARRGLKRFFYHELEKHCMNAAERSIFVHDGITILFNSSLILLLSWSLKL